MPDDEKGRKPRDTRLAKTLTIETAEVRKIQAIVAHLRVVLGSGGTSTGPRMPRSVPQEELLLASASLRALFFDNGGMLISFLDDHGADLAVEGFETDLGLILLSELLNEELHVSDALVEALVNRSSFSQGDVDEPWTLLVAYKDRAKFASVLAQAELWAPPRASGISGPSPASNVGPVQLLTLCRRRVGIRDWGKLRLGYLKTTPIDRRAVVTHVANKLGGVHYDPTRLPAKSDDRDSYKALTAAYDWDNEALTSAGLIGVSLACIEMAHSPDVVMLAAALDKFAQQRQARLRTEKS